MKSTEIKQYGIFKLPTTFQRLPSGKLIQKIVLQMTLLRTGLTHYFRDIICWPTVCRGSASWIRSLSIRSSNRRNGRQEEVVDIQADETTKNKHTEWSPRSFWPNMGSTHRTLARNDVPQLLVFPSVWSGNRRCRPWWPSRLKLGAIFLRLEMTTNALWAWRYRGWLVAKKYLLHSLCCFSDNSFARYTNLKCIWANCVLVKQNCARPQSVWEPLL